MYIHDANQQALEAQMIRRAKEIGFGLGEVHHYGNYLQNWGI
jgi:hypothetical protein